MSELGEMMKKRRKAMKMTQKQLADKLHCTPQNVSAWETGQRNVGAQYLRQLANVLEISREQLYELAGDDVVKENVYYNQFIGIESVEDAMAFIDNMMVDFLPGSDTVVMKFYVRNISLLALLYCLDQKESAKNNPTDENESYSEEYYELESFTSEIQDLIYNGLLPKRFGEYKAIYHADDMSDTFYNKYNQIKEI